MRHFRLISNQIDVAPLVSQIDSHPELWDQHRVRTEIEGGPFWKTSDIWCRYRALAELTSIPRFMEPHFAEWYPCVGVLPDAKKIALDLLSATRAEYLGGVLITRIPAGGRIKPHDDRGSWHAEFCNLKIYVPLKSNERCVNYCGGDSVVMEPGTAWEFNNLVTHSVVNDGDCERWTLIVCLRKEPPYQTVRP